jgi:hypothetical protein
VRARIRKAISRPEPAFIDNRNETYNTLYTKHYEDLCSQFRRSGARGCGVWVDGANRKRVRTLARTMARAEMREYRAVQKSDSK